MVEIEKEIKKDEKIVENFLKSKNNLWMIVSIILAVALILSLAMQSDGVGGMSESKAGAKLVDYLNSKVGSGVEFKNATSLGSLYEIIVSYQNQNIPVYISKDGKYFIQGITEITSSSASSSSTANAGTQTPTNVPKTDKPKVEAFVFSYCPYGLQFEKALLPAYNLLKTKADINIVAIGAMHGEYEKIESLRQMCIQKTYGKDKLWAYLDQFMGNTAIGNCRGDAACLTPLLNPIFTNLSINSATITSCMAKDAEALYNADGARAAELGISGSPTFVINGVQVQVGRTPDAIKTAICSAFTTSPAECNQTLSTSSMAAGFGYTAGATSATQCGV